MLLGSSSGKQFRHLLGIEVGADPLEGSERGIEVQPSPFVLSETVARLTAEHERLSSLVWHLELLPEGAGLHGRDEGRPDVSVVEEHGPSRREGCGL